MASDTLTGRVGLWAPAGFPTLPLWAWALLATLAFAGFSVLTGGVEGIWRFSDSDDATRLIQVRELMATGAWFDTTLPGLGGSEPLLSHWSRLVDLPIAALIAIFGLFMPQQSAEIAARTLWPLMLMGLTLWIMARAAEAKAGQRGVRITLVLAVLCLSGTVQFSPGRIDHHSVMVLCAIGGTLFLARSYARPRSGLGAGLLLGLGTAVGYEALILSIATLAVAGIMAVITGAGRSGVRRAALGFSFALTAAFFVTVAPWRWFAITCDALSLNMVLLATTAAAGLVGVLHMRPRRSLEIRLAALAATGITALALYASSEPACLKGPFGQLDPRLWPVWLDHVRETHGIVWMAETLPLIAGAFVVHVALGCLAAIAIYRKDRDNGTLFFAIVMVIWAVTSLWQVKLMAYAAMLAVPAIGVAIARLDGMASISAPTTRFIAAAFGNQQSILILLAVMFGMGGAATKEFQKKVAAKQACLAAESIAPLARLPRGLIVADIDLGPFIAVATDHAVLAGPYHRLGKQILETNDIFYSSLDEAERRLRRTGARYVVTCEAMAMSGRSEPPPTGSLKPELIAGRAPSFLEAVPLNAASPLSVWRLK